MILVCAHLANAADIGDVSYGGNGCPDGTVASSTSQSRTTISIKLNEMETLTGDQTGAAIARKACAISVPIEIPAGKTLESVQATYEGNAIVAEDAVVKFQSEHFVSGGKGKVNKITLEANEGSAFRIIQNSRIQSGCGQGILFRANFSLLNQATANSSLSAGVIDRAKFKLNFADCGN